MTYRADHKLSIPTMGSYGFGQIAESVKNIGFSVFLLFYYNQVLQVSATGTSIVLAIAVIFDAISDPLAGSLSDKTRTRWGRRHPFIVVAAAPLAISFYCLFNPPAGMSEFANLGWLLVFAILVRSSMTFYSVPHLALGAEMARNYNQRTNLFAFNIFFAAIGSALFVQSSYIFFFPTTDEFDPGLLNQAAYGPWALTAGGIMMFAILVCVLGTAKEIPNLRNASSKAPQAQFSLLQLFREVVAAFSNRSFRAVFFGMLVGTIVWSVESVFTPFMGFHFWGLTTEQLAILPLGSIAGLLASCGLIGLSTKLFDKKPTLIVSSSLNIINSNLLICLALLGFAWFPRDGSTALVVALTINTAVGGFLTPIFSATMNSMFADITDEHELDVGERREGMIFAARAFAVKATSSIGLVFGGFLLDYIEFPRGAALGTVPEDIVWQLGFIAGPATSIFGLVGVLLYLGYRIDRERHAEIAAAIDAGDETRPQSAQG